MSRKVYKPEQIIRKLREVEIFMAQGMTAQQAVRQIGVTDQTCYRWRKEYGGMQVDQAKRLIKHLNKRTYALSVWWRKKSWISRYLKNLSLLNQKTSKPGQETTNS